MKKYLLAFILILNACAAPQSTATGTASADNASANLSTATSMPPRVTPTETPEAIPTATFPAPPSAVPSADFTMRVSPQDGMTQLLVPAGKLHMGGMDIYTENDEQPVHDVSLREFWVDETEVTNGMYNLCVDAGTCRPPQKLSSVNRPSYFDNADFQDYPVIQITWGDAKNYCAWAGKRLPTEAEWERAARGDDMRTYPWGDEPPSQRYANYDNLIRDTSRVGSYGAGASPFGALDMAGNVWEWVSDFYDLDYYLSSPAVDPAGPQNGFGRYQRVIRGGSYQDGSTGIRLANRGYELGPNPQASYGSPEIWGHSSVKIGVRCVSDQ